MSAPSKWAPAIVAQAKTLWLDGKSAAEVSRAIGHGLSRNAVIGKMMRLGLARDDSVGRNNRARAMKSHSRKDHAWSPAPKTRPRLASVPLNVRMTGAVGSAEPLRLVDLCAGHCRWPVSGEGAETLFCCVAIERGSYCQGHSAVAFAPEKTPRQRQHRRAA